jgi:tetratricopeptide (TPR) repeat protein
MFRQSTLLFTVLALVAYSSPSWLYAASEQQRYLLSQPTYRSMSTIHELMNSGKSHAALNALNKLLLKVRHRPYESAVILQTMGYVCHTLGRDAQAIAYFEQALAKKTLPNKVVLNVTYNLVQLLITSKNYQKGLHYLKQWFEQEAKPSAQSLFLAATAYFYVEQYEQAILYVNKAIANASPPQKYWYQLLLACYYELTRYKEAARILEQLTNYYPKERDYWIQLAGVYQKLNRDTSAVAILELAYRMDMLEETDMLRLVNLYLYRGMPYQAAQLLDTEMEKGSIKRTTDHWLLLTDSLVLAQEPERAITALRQAAKLADKGSLYQRLGQMLYRLERWEEAVQAFDTALGSDRLDQPARVQLLLGVAAQHAGFHKRARSAFIKALDDDETREQAQAWLDRLTGG